MLPANPAQTGFREIVMALRTYPPASQAYAYPLTVKCLLAASRQSAGQRTISYRSEMRYDYTTFLQRVARLANLLTAHGIGKGDVVAVMDWDSHRYLECYFAIPMIGAVLQTVNVRLAPAQIAYTLADTGARAVLFHRDFVPLVSVLPLDGVDVRIAMMEGEPCTMPGVIGEYETLMAQASPIYAFEDIDENAIATAFHTTGTVGDPKMVAFTHRQIVLHTLGVAAGFAARPAAECLRSEDVYMPLTPMFHVHAWGMPYVATMVGAQQVYPGRYEPDRIIALQKSEGVGFSHCVPTILQMILAAAEAQDIQFENWAMVIGGARLSPLLHKAAKARGIHTFAGYGMSETCPIISTAHALDNQTADEQVAARVAAGYPAPLVETAVADLETGEIRPGIPGYGELVVRAPWLTQSYPNKPEASEALWQGGWLHTQDVATIAPDGRIEIVDRLKDVIKSGGEWVSTGTLEELSLKHPHVAEVAFVGVPDEKWGERPGAAIVLKPGAGHLDCAQLQEHLMPSVSAGVISRYALPVAVKVVEALPRTSVGKIDKKAIRSWLAV